MLERKKNVRKEDGRIKQSDKEKTLYKDPHVVIGEVNA
jgi:hypothetical protein